MAMATIPAPAIPADKYDEALAQLDAAGCGGAAEAFLSCRARGGRHDQPSTSQEPFDTFGATPPFSCPRNRGTPTGSAGGSWQSPGSARSASLQ